MKVHEIISIIENVNFTLPVDIKNVEFIGDYDTKTRIGRIGSIVSSERGAGRKAVSAFEEWAREQGAERITAEARRESLPFWWKMGFRDRSRGERLVPIWKIIG